MKRQAIIDIGSNSIRLVVYDGPSRQPAVLFNEKILAGLGRGVARNNLIDPVAMEASFRALSRFRLIAEQMKVDTLRVVATAAVRDARNGGDLVERAHAIGIEPDILDGAEEARAAGLGVISAIPGACGIVGDLGGGSLELVRVGDAETHESLSLPLGVLRVGAIRDKGKGALNRHVAKQLKKHDWLKAGRNAPLYLVGGSWRALARIDMALTRYPLPILHQYAMGIHRPEILGRALTKLDPRKLQGINSLSVSRLPMLSDAAALLAALVSALKPAALIVSTSGIREGLLYDSLDAGVRKEDPLIVATRSEGRAQGRFPQHGDLLDRWIAPLFARDPAETERLRHAACLLADVGWRANPEYRADRGIEMALHGNWVGVDAAGRAMMAQALATSFGAGAAPLPQLVRLCSADALNRAGKWGLAMRLGQRLSGGVAEPLERSTLHAQGKALILRMEPDFAALYGESVERRHRQLALALGLEARLG